MTIKYRSGSEGSVFSFFTTTPLIIFRVQGSIIPYVLPQIFITVGLAFYAVIDNPMAGIVHDSTQILAPLAFLLSFLLVFKTTTAFEELSRAYGVMDEMRMASRVLARAASAAYLFHHARLSCEEDLLLERSGAQAERLGEEISYASGLPVQCDTTHVGAWEENPQQSSPRPPGIVPYYGGVVPQTPNSKAQPFLVNDPDSVIKAATFTREMQEDGLRLCRKVFRLILLYWHVMIEFFQRTGENQTRDKGRHVELRNAVKRFASRTELKRLYPKDGAGHCSPTVLLYWLKVVCMGLVQATKSDDLTLSSTNGTLGVLDNNFSILDDIDKNQFPLPYAQIVKLLVIFFVFFTPFVLEPSCGKLTPLVSAFVALGFFGLDEMAEILDAPLGCDPNSIDLEKHASELAEDLDSMWSDMMSGSMQDILEGPEDFEEQFVKVSTGKRELNFDSSSPCFLPKTIGHFMVAQKAEGLLSHALGLKESKTFSSDVAPRQ
jgi:predicted membrane chloride channel (bestrophin family)